MITHLKKTLIILRERAERNLEIIHMNDQIAKAMLKEPFSEERSAKIEERYQENKKLLKENNDSMHIQFEITRFIENYYNELKEVENRSVQNYSKNNSQSDTHHSRENILKLTINGEIPFNENHPFYWDEAFFNDLLSYYEKIEDYETCNNLLNKRKKKR
ncbi:MAG: hypothetical protein ACQER7_01275 [Bacteroidota bacterium]